MSRWSFVVLVTTLAVLLAGCGGGNPHVASADDVQRIPPQESKTLLDEGKAVLYDVRSAEAYQTQHAAGAVSLPEEEVAARFSELPDGKALIFY